MVEGRRDELHEGSGSEGNTDEQIQKTAPHIQQFNELGIEVLKYVEGVNSRPVTSSGKEGYFGNKNYLAISRELQAELGIEKPSEHIVAILREGGKYADFYILTGLLPDEDWESDNKKCPGFISRADKGAYVNARIYDGTLARHIVEAIPIETNSFGTPFYEYSLTCKKVEMAILDLEQMRGRNISTLLSAKTIDDGYPKGLIERWQNEKSALEEADGTSYPTLVVPNAIAKLAGADMSHSTNQPSSLGNTVTGGELCFVRLPDGTEMQAFVVGALDCVGIPEELQDKFTIGEKYEVKISVNNGIISFVSRTQERLDTILIGGQYGGHRVDLEKQVFIEMPHFCQGHILLVKPREGGYQIDVREQMPHHHIPTSSIGKGITIILDSKGKIQEARSWEPSEPLENSGKVLEEILNLLEKGKNAPAPRPDYMDFPQ